MFIQRAQRKNRSLRVTVVVALAVLGVVSLVVVLAGSDPHGVPVDPSPASSGAATTSPRNDPRGNDQANAQADAQADASGAVAADDVSDPAAEQRATTERQKLSALQAEIEKSSQELGTLRAAAEQARAEVAVLHEQRDAMLHPPTDARPNAAEAPATQASPPVQEPQAAKMPAPANAAPASATSVSVSPAEHRSSAKMRSPHTARDFLRLAREQLEAGRTAEAEDALEKAETRALNNNAAFHGGLDPTDSPLVDRIAAARRALRAGNTARALRLAGEAPANPRRSAHAGPAHEAHGSAAQVSARR